MKKFRVILACALLAAASLPAHAQFGNLLGKKENTGAAGPDQIVAKFVESQTHIIGAQIKFAEAFDLQDQVTLLRAEQQALTGDQVDTSALKKSREVSDGAQAAIEARMTEQPELDAGGKSAYGEGLLSYAKGLLAAKQTLDAAQAAGRSLGVGSLTSGGRAAMFVVKESPGYFNSLRTSSRMVFEYGKRNKLEAPADATSMLDGL